MVKHQKIIFLISISFIFFALISCNGSSQTLRPTKTPMIIPTLTPSPDLPAGETYRDAWWEVSIQDHMDIDTVHMTGAKEAVVFPPLKWVVVIIQVKNIDENNRDLNIIKGMEGRKEALSVNGDPIDLSGFIWPNSISDREASGYVAGVWTGLSRFHDDNDQEWKVRGNDVGDLSLTAEIEPGNIIEIGLLYTLGQSQNLKGIYFRQNQLMLVD